MDLERLREKCDRLQWSTADIDWEAPGADCVTPEQGATLRPFLSDLFWIESTAALVFTAMAGNEADPTRRAIFESFALDEHRHAEAERLLMVRWGLLGRHERPAPNSNVRRLIDTLEHHAARVSPSVFSAIIPMTELAPWTIRSVIEHSKGSTPTRPATSRWTSTCSSTTAARTRGSTTRSI